MCHRVMGFSKCSSFASVQSSFRIMANGIKRKVLSISDKLNILKYDEEFTEKKNKRILIMNWGYPLPL